MDTVASHPILAIKTVLSLLEEKGTVEQQLHVLGQLAHLVQQLHDLNSEITTEVNGLPGLFAGLFGVPTPAAVAVDESDGMRIADMQIEDALEILRQLLHLARDPCELPRRNVERHMRSMLRWPVRTWAMLALLVAVSTACVLVCSAALKTPETRWSTAVGAIAVVLAAAVMLVATRDADIARRHTSINEVLSGIGELQARTVALQLLASQLAPLGLQHFSQLLAAMMNKLDSTTMQAQQALFDMP